jgi:hypothetical protein
VPELKRSNNGLHGHLWEADFPECCVIQQQTVRLVAEHGEKCDQHQHRKGARPVLNITMTVIHERKSWKISGSKAETRNSRTPCICSGCEGPSIAELCSVASRVARETLSYGALSLIFYLITQKE